MTRIMTALPKDLHLFETDLVAVAEMLLLMRRKGIRNTKVLCALEVAPRRLFLPSTRHQVAYRDRPQPLEFGQMICAPSTVGVMTEALDVHSGHRVLQIGTGSGYQAAVLALMGAKVFTMERYSGLAALARQRFSVLRLKDIEIKCGDGSAGWPEPKQFNRILLSASVSHLPERLADQLCPGGLLVAPVGAPDRPQALMRYENTSQGLMAEQVGVGRVTPLYHGKARVL